MKNIDAFSQRNPILNFSYFTMVIVFTMFFIHPLYLLTGTVLSSLYYLTLKRREGISFLLKMLPIIVIIGVINPFFVEEGTTVIFTHFGGRAYTLQALLYGLSTGLMCYNICLWFASYNFIMTSDKFIYLFGRLIPSISLLFSMVLRFIPNFENKARIIATARRSVGKGFGDGNKRDQIEHTTTILSVLTSWALESAVTTADSMKSRGYGLKGRTSFSNYQFTIKDALMLLLMVVLASFVLIASIKYQSTQIIFYPTIKYTAVSIAGILGYVCYVILLAIPPMLNLSEVIIWRVLKSRI